MTMRSEIEVKFSWLSRWQQKNGNVEFCELRDFFHIPKTAKRVFIVATDEPEEAYKLRLLKDYPEYFDPKLGSWRIFYPSADEWLEPLIEAGAKYIKCEYEE